MRRGWSAAVAAGAAAGAAPFALWMVLPEGNPYSEWVTRKVATVVAEHNHTAWQRGDKRPKRIILMRHGQTHGYTHCCDCKVAGLPVCSLKPEMERPLTEEGKLQALRAGIALKHVVGDETCTFFVSPYKSCKQTFSYVSGSFQDMGSCQVVEDPRLRNQDRGDWYLTNPAEKVEDYMKDSEAVGKFFYRWPGGESAADVHDRMSSFMETMYRKWQHVDRPDNFVIITHSVCIQAWIHRWFHLDVETFNRLEKFKNGQIAVMEKQENGSYKLVTPLPCKPPIPNVVKFLASNPTRHDSN
mmetsp:Transcript_14626/g.26222  ORF Transcript_14626/g.26222 Transcript_14626/m.26222 type:complete len:299 (+) Transcript_14626:100-996(+)